MNNRRRLEKTSKGAASAQRPTRDEEVRPDSDDFRQPIDPNDVQDRNQLHQYLNQSISSEYKVRTPSGKYSQTATYVKSYIVEMHSEVDQTGIERWSGAFTHVLQRRDPALLLLVDRHDVPYFVDLSESRFITVHTIGKTEATDDTMTRLTQGGIEGFDRAWLPTDFLYGSRRGPLRGFKFGHLAAVAGVSSDGDELDDFVLDVASEEMGVEVEPGTEYEEMPSVPSEYDLELLPVVTQRAGVTSRLSVSNTLTADSDFRLIQEADVFAGRQALDVVQFVARDETGERINASIYSTGKFIGSGTSLGLHLVMVEGLRLAYSRAIQAIENDFSLGWVSSNDGKVHHGEPLIFTFPDGMITDLSLFVSSMFRSARPFRLFGIPHSISEQRIDVEAIDLHTNDPLSFEITPSWMRVYLPKGSCGNIIARLYTNLQHSAHSGVRLVSGSAVLLFAEGDATNE